MERTVVVLVFLCASPLFIAALHALASRLLVISGYRVEPQMVCAGSVLIGNIPVLASVLCLFSTDGPRAWMVLYSLIVYNALGYSYFHLFNMSETARRIRILIEVHRRGGIPGDELSSLYDTSQMVDLRIERLLASGQIREVDGRYVIKGRILYLAARLLSLWAALLDMPLGVAGK